MARILIVGDASRGLRLASALFADGHAVRLVTSDPERRHAIEQVGAECFIGAPDRLATLRGSLEHVTVACWLLADASGDPEQVRVLHGPRLASFLGAAIDTTLRGFVYESGGITVPADLLAGGERIVSETAARNLIPVGFIRANPLDADEWLREARATVDTLLVVPGPRP